MLCDKGLKARAQGAAQCPDCGLNLDGHIHGETCLLGEPPTVTEVSETLAALDSTDEMVTARADAQNDTGHIHTPTLSITRYHPFLPKDARNDFEVFIPEDFLPGLTEVEIEIQSDMLKAGTVTQTLQLEGKQFINDIRFCPQEAGQVSARFTVRCKTDSEQIVFSGRNAFVTINDTWSFGLIHSLLRGKRVEMNMHGSVAHRVLNDADIDELFINADNSVLANAGNESNGGSSGKLDIKIGWDVDLTLVSRESLMPAERPIPITASSCVLRWQQGATVGYTRIYRKPRVSFGRVRSGTDVWIGVLDEEGRLDPDMQDVISRRHFSIRHADGFQIRDEGSRNLTFVNGGTVEDNWVPLPDGARIQPGRHMDLQIVAEPVSDDALLLHREQNGPGLENWLLLPNGSAVDLSRLAGNGDQESGAWLVHEDGGFQIIAIKDGIKVGSIALDAGDTRIIADGDRIIAGDLRVRFGVGSGYPASLDGK